MQPLARRKIGVLALAAATYSMVSGGPFGLEEIVGANGYARALLILCLTPLLWALPTTLMVSEMASALPVTGGFYVWVRRSLGPFWGFQESWLTFLGSIFDMAVYPILFSACLTHLLPALGLGSRPLFIGLAMIALATVMNLFGAHLVGESNLGSVLLFLAPFAVLVWLGFASPASAAVPLTASTARPDLFGGILIAMWNYMGWDNASTIAGEVEAAPRSYPRAMLLALAMVVVTYLLPILAAAHAGTPQAAWETGSWVTIGGVLGGPLIARLLTAGGVLAAFSTFNTLVLSLSRLPAAMARDGYLPRIFIRENRFGAPWVAILVSAALWGSAVGLGFDRTLILDVLLTGMSILLEFVAFLVLRWREPDLERPFRVPLGWLGAILVSVPPIALIALSCVRSRREAIGPLNGLSLGALLMATGAVIYWFGVRRGALAARLEEAALED